MFNTLLKTTKEKPNKINLNCFLQTHKLKIWDFYVILLLLSLVLWMFLSTAINSIKPCGLILQPFSFFSLLSHSNRNSCCCFSSIVTQSVHVFSKEILWQGDIMEQGKMHKEFPPEELDSWRSLGLGFGYWERIYRSSTWKRLAV